MSVPDAPAGAVRRHEVLAVSLLAVLIAAKIAVLAGRSIPASPWAPIAYLWQDVAVALGFLLVALLVRQEWTVRLIYGALVVLAAVNVPVARVLSSPLTSSMLRAARGTLGDSILHYATPGNIVLIASLLALGAAAPVVLMRRPLPRPRRWLAAAIACVALGPIAGRRVDTAGLERNPVTALARTSLPRIRPAASDADWRLPLAHAPSVGSHPDLSPLRGAAAGMNVLLVVLESTGAQYLRTYGAAEDPMPNLSRLAERSLVFDNAYAIYPESIKGLLAYLASRYPAFDVPPEEHAPLAAPSLATVLGTHGYETALVHSGRFFYLGMEEILARSGFGRLDDAGAIGGNRESSFGVDEAAAVRHLLRWIDSLPAGKRFFAAYLPIAGHHPYSYEEAGPFPEETEVDRYRNALHEGDRALGELLTGLLARRLDRSTVVIVFGDHAEAFGQHPGNYGHTLAIWDENVRVPLMIAVPGSDDGGVRIPRVASLVDIPPTVLDLLKIAPPPSFQGSSLLDGEDRVALFYTDYSLGLLGLRDGCLKFIHELESDRSKLFDLCSDPGERADVAAGHPEQVRAYRARVREWSAAQVAAVRARRDLPRR